MTEKNLFEIATRRAFRYPSNRGDLTTEQLWSLPLLNKDGFSLNNVAMELNRTLKELTEESFVSIRPKAGQEDLEAKLDIVKHIIHTLQAERAAARDAAERAAKRERLIQILANKEEQELANLSVDEIRAKLAELD